MLFSSRQLRGRCLCGAEHAACGPPSDSVPVDQMMEVAVMGGPLKKYQVVTPSGAQTVIKFNDDDALRHGLTEEDLVGGPVRQSKPDSATAPEAVEEKAVPASPNKSRASSANKSRTPRGAGTKGGAGGGG